MNFNSDSYSKARFMPFNEKANSLVNRAHAPLPAMQLANREKLFGCSLQKTYK
jgi:hypothetical protein